MSVNIPYIHDRPLKQHEEVCLMHIEKLWPDPSRQIDILDIACADGNFIEKGLLTKFPYAKIEGFDLSPELIERAENKLKNTNVKLSVCDVSSFESNKKYDLIIASGILSHFDNPHKILDKWINLTKSGGTLIMFGLFNPNDVDTKVYYREASSENNDYHTGLNMFSVNAIKNYIIKRDFKVDVDKFNLSFDISKPTDPAKAYTFYDANGQKEMRNNANIIVDLFYLICTKK